MRFAIPIIILQAALLAGARHADAHFLWLAVEPAEQPNEVRLYFSESASPDDPELLDRVTGTRAWAIAPRSEPQDLSFRKVDDALVAELPATRSAATVVARHTYGVISRGGETFLLNYYAKAVPSVLPGTWRSIDDTERLPLEIVPGVDGSSVTLQVRWQGEPVAGAQVTVDGPELESVIEGETDADGRFSCRLPVRGVYSIRARMVESVAGEHDGASYSSVRHYSTLTLPYEPSAMQSVPHNWSALPRGITSFGAAVVDGYLYVYGGHYGAAHHYSQEGQSGDFRRLNLASGREWEDLPGGPKLTGVPLVAHDGRLYRVGGFTAENSEGEDERLASQAGFARFDPATGQWEDLPSLPEGRSSHDAVVLGDMLYVVGGWNMQPGSETAWHSTAWSVDLSQEHLEWKPVASPPFQRRALALASWKGKLYALGGMEPKGPTTKVAVFDPQQQTWTDGPSLLGSGMEGFGASGFGTDDGLYVTTMSGSVQRLADDGSRWEFAGQLVQPRFFHRLLPLQGDDWVIVGGADMSVGKIVQLERLTARSTNDSAGP